MVTCKADGCHCLNRFALPTLKPCLYPDHMSFCTTRCAKRNRRKALFCTAPGCLRLALNAVPINKDPRYTRPGFDPKKYCYQCAAARAQDLSYQRSIIRMDRFLNKLFLDVRKVTISMYLQHEKEVDQELQLHMFWRLEGPSGDYYDSTTTSLRGRLAFLSHNQCDTAMGHYAGIIAFLREGRVIPYDCRLRSTD